MTKLSRKVTDPAKFGHYVNNLWSAFTLMDSKADIRLLFRDLFTHTEYKMFAKRLEIARMLLQKESYLSIQQELNVTANTVTRVSNVLSEKGEGLRKAHGKLVKAEEKYAHKESPALPRLHRRTVLGTALKAGIVAVDKKISKTLKERTVRKELPV